MRALKMCVIHFQKTLLMLGKQNFGNRPTLEADENELGEKEKTIFSF